MHVLFPLTGQTLVMLCSKIWNQQLLQNSVLERTVVGGKHHTSLKNAALPPRMDGWIIVYKSLGSLYFLVRLETLQSLTLSSDYLCFITKVRAKTPVEAVDGLPEHLNAAETAGILKG